MKSVFVAYLFFDFQCCDSFINLAVIESTCASIENVYKAAVYFRVYLRYTTLCFGVHVHYAYYSKHPLKYGGITRCIRKVPQFKLLHIALYKYN